MNSNEPRPQWMLALELGQEQVQRLTPLRLRVKAHDVGGPGDGELTIAQRQRLLFLKWRVKRGDFSAEGS